VRRCGVYVEKGPETFESTFERAVAMETAPSALTTTHAGPFVFISHSSKDADLALALIDLLKAGLGLLADQIRCSSVDGYRLPVGVNTESKLREEVNAAPVVIGLITPSSLLSYYVMFELGARWGSDLFLAPLLAGVKAGALSGPLSLLNALAANSEAQLHQLLKDISDQLGRPLQNTASYLRYVSTVKALAEGIPTSANAKNRPTEFSPVKVEFDPFSGQFEKMFLTVTNRGAKQVFYAQCRVIERRNDPNPQHRMTFDLRWQHGGKEKYLAPGEAGNLLVASTGEDKSRGMEWMKLEGTSGPQAPESRWAWSEKKRPEYDLEITVLGNKSDQPQAERFTLRAGSTRALEMVGVLVERQERSSDVTESDPRVYLVDIGYPEDSMFPKTPFIIENRGKDVAHRIQVQPMIFGFRRVTFPLIDNLPKETKQTVLPLVEDAEMDKHCILPVLREAWNAAGMKNGAKDFLEFPFSLQMTYESFEGSRRVETAVELTYSYTQKMMKRDKKWPNSEFKIFDIKRTTFRML
jgi:TIR domain